MLLNMNTTYQTNRFLFFTLLFLFGFATSLSLTAQTIYYVDATKANNDGDGTSWATAKKELQVALDTATPGDEIRVASGAYFPTDAPNGSTTNDRNKAFHLNKDLILKGSYDPATEMQDYTNPSILSGDIGMQDDNTDNAYHVLITANLSSDAIIDGFTFSGGNADGTGSLVFDSESFTRDDGGGIYNYESSPTITNSILVRILLLLVAEVWLICFLVHPQSQTALLLGILLSVWAAVWLMRVRLVTLLLQS